MTIKEESVVENSAVNVFLELDNGEFTKVDMSLPLQMLFDDVMTFVSKIDVD